MINATLYNKIIATLGKQYSPKIIAHLNKKGITNENGEAFKPASIQKIVKHGRENLPIETEILKLIAMVQRQQKKLKQDKSKILKNK